MALKAKSRDKANWDEQAEDGGTIFQSHANNTDYTKHKVSQTNELIRSLQEMTVVGLRLARMVFGRLDPTCLSEEQCKDIKIKTSDYEKLWGVDRTTAFRNLRVGTKQLLSRVIEITDTGGGWEMYPVARNAKMKNGELTINLNPDIIPFLIDMKNKSYTTYDIIDLVNLESKYTIRLFELLTAQMGKKNKCKFFRRIEDLRKVLDVPPSYGHSMFMKTCINIPLAEMEKHLGIVSTVEQESKEGGKKISHLTIETSRSGSFKLELQDPDFPPIN